MSQTAYEYEINSAGEHKAESLTDPNGVLYMDHLWNIVLNEDDLTVVLRTDTEIFDRIGVRAWWEHGHYAWQDQGDQEKSNLVFEVPDEVTRRLQSRHAQSIMHRFFGQTAELELEAPFLGDNSDGTRSNSLTQHVDVEEILDDWSVLKQAIGLTSKDASGYLGGQSLSLLSTAGTSHGLARVQGKQLELYIPSEMIEKIERLWSAAFKREIQLEK